MSNRASHQRRACGGDRMKSKASAPRRARGGDRMKRKDSAPRRARAATLTIAAVITGLLALAIVQVVGERMAVAHPLDYAVDYVAGETSNAARTSVDVLGIASEQLVFEDASDDARILWYSTTGGLAYCRAVVDQALCSRGWVSCSEEGQLANSYVHYSASGQVARYLMVLYYELLDGCSVIIEVL